MLRELIKQKTDIKYISKVDKLAGVALENSETNITLVECLDMVSNISKLNSNEINMFVLPVSNRVNDGSFFCTMDKEAAQNITDKYFQSK
jgi:anionic cell wall polymer biosynthesis LytR-Cps2A-Psr (LCP) family protein